MENPEEILHSLEEFSKTRPKDIPRELEDYLSFVAKTGDPIYQWPAIKSLFREKMINVIAEFYEACPLVEVPPCPNVDLFNYDVMKGFILEKLDTFSAAPFTLQRISELLTCPRKEYNRLDKYMRALEKNILVVSTTEPGGRRMAENGDGVMNGLESEHLPETSNSSNDINVEEMDDTPSWPRLLQNETSSVSFQTENQSHEVAAEAQTPDTVQETVVTASKTAEAACSSSQDTVITCRALEEPYVSIEAVPLNTCAKQETPDESDVSVTITAIPAGVQKRRSSIEPVVSSESITESTAVSSPEASTTQDEQETSSSSEDVKDADSSSKEEDEKLIDDKSPDSSSPSSTETNISQTDSSSNVEEEETKEPENVIIKEIMKQQEEIKPESSEDKEIDCSIDTTSKPQSVIEEKTDGEEAEISSSNKEEEIEMEISNEAEAEPKIEPDHVEEESSVSVEKDQIAIVEKEVSATEMDVEELNNSEKLEIVKAEATSHSTL